MRLLGHRRNVGHDAAQDRRRRRGRPARAGGAVVAVGQHGELGRRRVRSGRAPTAPGSSPRWPRSASTSPSARVAVIGAGGAARSVIDALGRAGTSDITVLNRSPARPPNAAAQLATAASVGIVSDVTRADIVVNATSVGMGVDWARPSRTCRASPTCCAPSRSWSTSCTTRCGPRWLTAADEVGARTVDGLGMLDPSGRAAAAALARHAARRGRDARRRRVSPPGPLTPTLR